MTSDEKISRILEIELYLTKKIIDNRNTGYKPSMDDKINPLERN